MIARLAIVVLVWALILISGLIASSNRQAQAQRVYVDATAGRTTNTGPESALTGPAADDNLWAFQIGASSSNTFFQSGDGDGEDAPQIFTRISQLLPNMLYSVHAHFWDTAAAWNIRAGFASGNLPLYSSPADADALAAHSAVLASTLTYATPPTVFVTADRTMYAAWLGTVKSNSSGMIDVYIDDLPSTTGLNERTWYDGVSLQPTTLQTLTLRVNTSTGGLAIRNEAGTPVDINYYEIRSATQALDTANWNSLNDQDGHNDIGDGWDEAGGSSADILSEVNLFSAAHFDNEDATSLGNAFLQGGTKDLTFFYGISGQSVLTPGYVEYVTNTSLGDYNGNGMVDAADYTVWRNSLGDMGAGLPADGDEDGGIDLDDFHHWKSRFGESTASGAGANDLMAANAPEPSGIFLVAAAAAISGPRRLRRPVRSR